MFGYSHALVYLAVVTGTFVPVFYASKHIFRIRSENVQHMHTHMHRMCSVKTCLLMDISHAPIIYITESYRDTLSRLVLEGTS